jgi:putative ABC transport system permease protein
MFFGPAFVLAVREIRRHLLRSFLTILGIVIGVAAVVTMVTLGNGATAAVQKQISGLGANLLQIRPGQGFGRGGGGRPRPISKPPTWKRYAYRLPRGHGGTAGTILGHCDPQRRELVHHGQRHDCRLLPAQQWRLSAGRVFSRAEEQAGKAVCVIGATVQRSLFRATIRSASAFAFVTCPAR